MTKKLQGYKEIPAQRRKQFDAKKYDDKMMIRRNMLKNYAV